MRSLLSPGGWRTLFRHSWPFEIGHTDQEFRLLRLMRRGASPEVWGLVLLFRHSWPFEIGHTDQEFRLLRLMRRGASPEVWGLVLLFRHSWLDSYT
jgi:hypothetical protein